MYPFLRMAKELIKYQNAPKLPVDGLHVSHHRCWPWDLDGWGELNNGRTLSLFDLGRIGLAQRIGLITALRTHRWGLTVAGASIRYRHRIRGFEPIEMRSQVVFWDEKFVYIEQVILKKDGQCATQILLRTGVVDKDGMVSSAQVAAALGQSNIAPACPKWVAEWITADAQRPWPPALATG